MEHYAGITITLCCGLKDDYMSFVMSNDGVIGFSSYGGVVDKDSFRKLLKREVKHRTDWVAISVPEYIYDRIAEWMPDEITPDTSDSKSEADEILDKIRQLLREQ